MQKTSLLIILVSSSLVCSIGSADIVLDFSHDTNYNSSGTGFFAQHAQAKAAIEAAANDISRVLRLNGSLKSISEAQNDVTGSSGSTSATNQYRLTYTNPVTGLGETLDPFSLQTDEIRVFVGMRNLTGSTLGQGGPGGFGWSFSGGGFASEWLDTIDDLESKSNAILGRDHGPTIQTLDQSVTLGGVTANYSVSKGPTHGNLWFDSDTDNMNGTDSIAELEASWHFDHTTSVDAGKIDFYSVALHEILHSIGYGVSESFDDLIDETDDGTADDDWLGAHAIAANGGSGSDLIDSGHGHLASGTMSTSIVDGSAQVAVMTPSISAGTRRHLTHLDIAILKDIGYTNAAAVPEPGTIAMMSVLSIGGAFYLRRRRQKKADESIAA